MNKIGVGLYGWNGHQINEELGDLETAYLAGICDADDKRAQFKTLRDLLVSSEIELVSMCSPNRGEQAGDIILALEAGKHVIAEKPCALNERDLDAILELSVKKGLIFCEMDHSYFAQPYYKAMELVELGAIGDVAQVLCQKSYPYTDLRPQDESMDGGLILQSALYGFRWIQNIAGQEIKNIHTFATSFGNPKKEVSVWRLPFKWNCKTAAWPALPLTTSTIMELAYGVTKSLEYSVRKEYCEPI